MHWCKMVAVSFALFTERRSYASAVLEVVILSVRQSVRPSVIRVLKIQRTYRRHFTPHERAMLLLVFWCQRSRRNSNGVTPNGGAK